MTTEDQHDHDRPFLAPGSGALVPGPDAKTRRDGAGKRIITATWAGTAMFAATAVTAAVSNDDLAAVVAAAVALTLFAAGIVVFGWAYAIAVIRSRTDAIGIGGLFFLAGAETAPKHAKRNLLAALAIQTAVALTTAGARPFTTLAFGVLVPLYGLALTGLFGARHGCFAPHDRPLR